MSRLLAYLRLALFTCFAWLFAHLLRWLFKRALRNSGIAFPDPRQAPEHRDDGIIDGECRREGTPSLPRV
jgi:hypothetical protein